MVDQPEPIAIGRDVDDVDFTGPGASSRIRDRDRPLAEDRVGTRFGHVAVARQEDIHGANDRLISQPADRPRERIDDVGETARLGPRLALG